MHSSLVTQTPAHIPAWKRLGLKLKYAQETTDRQHQTDHADSPSNLPLTNQHAEGSRFGDELSHATALSSASASKPTNGKKRAQSATGASTPELATTNGNSPPSNQRGSSRAASPPRQPQGKHDKLSSSVSSQVNTHISKKRKRHITDSQSVNGVPDGLSTPARPAGHIPSSDASDSDKGSTLPKIRRKSVTFTPDTKTEDGNSTQKRFSDLVANQVDLGNRNGDQTRDSLDSALVKGDAEVEDSDSERRIAEHKAKKRRIREEKRDGSAAPAPSYVNYLQQFHIARDQWKFNKNHQNQLLKHLFNLYRVPEVHDSAIETYIAGLRGQSIRQKLQDAAAGILQGKPASLEKSDVDAQIMDDSQRLSQARDGALQRRLQDHDHRRMVGTTNGASTDNRMQELKRKRAQVVLSALSEDHPLYPIQAFVAASANTDLPKDGTTTLEGDPKRVKLDRQRRNHKRLRKQRRSQSSARESSSESSSSDSEDSDSEETTSSSESDSTSSDSDSGSTSSGASSSSSGIASSSDSESGSTSESGASSSGSDPDSTDSDSEGAVDGELQADDDDGSTSSSSSSTP